ncbi:hypothetical protein B0J11DRAFT_526268 [Dendryphion nanum]|uniref:Secreted protein n=1 Tax=Dendryphion nanum TaxID=256645 RepID=A0A9P9INE7_9PLEO|nr:hypothetical protein B0J11DRAFT_526268 [Dendryphion nanum]
MISLFVWSSGLPLSMGVFSALSDAFCRLRARHHRRGAVGASLPSCLPFQSVISVPHVTVTLASSMAFLHRAISLVIPVRRKISF